MDDASLMQMAKAYADNDDYSVTRQYLYGLLDIIERMQAENAELKRVSADAEQCQKRLQDEADKAYGVAQSCCGVTGIAMGACVGYWENDK